MSEWQELKLGDVVNLKRGYDLPSHLRRDGDVPIFSSSGISGFHAEAKTQAPGVVTGRYGTIGQVFLATSAFWPLNTTLYVEDFKGNDEVFVYYFLKQINWEQFNDKSAVPGVNRNDAHQEDVRIPPLPEQKAIATVLSSLDDKIDLLHRQNKTLEALAQTLFRHWFVDGAQDDWGIVCLGDVVQTTSGGTPSRAKLEYYNNGTVPWIKSKELTGTYIAETEEKITEEGLKNSSAKLLPGNSILIAMYGATVGQYGILASPATCNQAVCALLPNDNYPYTFLFMLTKFHKENLMNLAVGSAQQNISQILIKSLNIHRPSHKILDYHQQIQPSFEKIKHNLIQIRTLEKLRDTLLPKLMSGEVRVADATEVTNAESHELFDRAGYLAMVFADMAQPVEAKLAEVGSDGQESNIPLAWFVIPETLYQLSEQPFPTPIGQTIYQKMCYVLTDEGVNTGFTFVPHNRGPYSTDAVHALSRLETMGIIKQVSIGRTMTEVRVQALYRSQRPSILDGLKQFQPMIERTVELFNHIKDTKHAEEIATILFSARQLEHKLAQRKVERSALHSYMITWKPHWNNRDKHERLDRAINGLVKMGFIAVS